MAKDQVFINCLVPIEDEIALRFIGAKFRMNRSELVRLAIQEFIKRNGAHISTLPRPKGAEAVPVVELPAELIQSLGED